MLFLNAAGGLALFMLAMQMMTNGLKAFAGAELKNILHTWTKTPARGVLTGLVLAGIVQSSGAVTVATIGFVNAGILTMAQSLGIIFGVNVGTTMTGWLVSLMGFGFKIEALAMPLIAIGVGFRFLAPAPRARALGEALAGFGLFFLGLVILKDSFSEVASTYGTELLTREAGSLPLLVLIGFVATFLTQSSSASIAVIMLAASQSVMGVNAAAAAIIGANVGTTTTALLASLGATPNARRVAAGHVLFNIGTATVALAILPWILDAIDHGTIALNLEQNVVVKLAIFHSTFNILGVMLFMPFIRKFARFLDSLFRSAEEDLSRPQFLDKTVIKTPTMAIGALWQELMRLNGLVCTVGHETFAETPHETERALARKTAAIADLAEKISDFTLATGMETLPEESSENLLNILKTSRYLEDVLEALQGLHALETVKKPEAQKLIAPLLPVLAQTFAAFSAPVSTRKANATTKTMEETYHNAKAAILKAAVLKKVPAVEANHLLDLLSHAHHASQQLAKANHMLAQGLPKIKGV